MFPLLHKLNYIFRISVNNILLILAMITERLLQRNLQIREAFLKNETASDFKGYPG